MPRVLVWPLVLLTACGLTTHPITPDLPVAYLGATPTLSGTIGNWPGQTGLMVEWREYRSPQPPVTLAIGPITADGHFTITLPSGAALQPFLHAFTGTNLPPYIRKTCQPNTLHFDSPPGASWGGLVVDVAGRTRSVTLEAVSGYSNGMMPAYFDREFTLSGEATCMDHGYTERYVGRMHGLRGWNWFSYRSTVTEGATVAETVTVKETLTEPLTEPLHWVLR